MVAAEAAEVAPLNMARGRMAGRRVLRPEEVEEMPALVGVLEEHHRLVRAPIMEKVVVGALGEAIWVTQTTT